MPLRLFNSMTHQKEDFIPLQPGKVGMYVCGVTTYDLCHVGNARVYVVFDALRRWLEREYAVTYVRNFTDVDDKIIRAAQQTGEEPLVLAARFADEYLKDMDALQVRRATVEPRVSTHMDAIIAFVRDLVDKGFAYLVPSTSTVAGAGSDVYFRVRRFDSARYLQLSGRSVDDMVAGARVAVDERKEDPLDFALWKSAKPGEPFWPSPFGNGRPGWHIECSAMAAMHLGVTFDIHGGGKDLVFPHHTNEIAQSECRHGAEMCRMWLHNGFVDVEADPEQAKGENADLVETITDADGNTITVMKMSKSLGNFFTVREVLKVFTPEALRLLLLSTHYRSPIAYAPRLVEEAERRVQRLYETRVRVARYLTMTPKEGVATLAQTFSTAEQQFDPWQDFCVALDDDFNTPRAVAALNEMTKVANLLVTGREKELTGKKLKPGERATLLFEWASIFQKMLGVLGVGEHDAGEFLGMQRTLRLNALGVTPAVVEGLLDARRTARTNKDFAAADAARDALLRIGIEVRDTPEGVEWSIA